MKLTKLSEVYAAQHQHVGTQELKNVKSFLYTFSYVPGISCPYARELFAPTLGTEKLVGTHKLTKHQELSPAQKLVAHTPIERNLLEL